MLCLVTRPHFQGVPLVHHKQAIWLCLFVGKTMGCFCGHAEPAGFSGRTFAPRAFQVPLSKGARSGVNIRLMINLMLTLGGVISPALHAEPD